MKSFTFSAFLVLTLMNLASTSWGQETGPRLSVEIDPATFVFGGYSAHLRVQPKPAGNWLFGAGIYAMDLPDVLVDLKPENRDEGWEVRIDLAAGLFAEHYFTEVNERWFIGAQAGWQRFAVDRPASSTALRFENALLLGYGGYCWQPFDFPLYVKGWAGLGYTTKLSGESTREGQTYEVAPVTGFATFHLGYTF